MRRTTAPAGRDQVVYTPLQYPYRKEAEVPTASRPAEDERASFRHSYSKDRPQLLRRLSIDEVTIATETGYLEPLLRFFRGRGRRVQRRW